MKLGIIGLPGSGRSTLFSALTGGVPPSVNGRKESVAVVRVPDERVDFLAEHFRPRKTTYAQVEYLLPAEAPAGEDGKGILEGLLNQARSCDAMLQVVRNFAGDGAGPARPGEDLARLEQELVFADFRVVEKRVERIEGDRKRGKPVPAGEAGLLAACLELLERDTPIRRRPDLAADPVLRGYALVSAKPELVIFNNADDDDSLPAVNGAACDAVSIAVRGTIES